MADLVYREPLLDGEPARRVERALLEEEPDLVAGAEEVLVARARLLARGEDRDVLRRVEVFEQRGGATPQTVAYFGRGEAFEDEESVPLVAREPFRAQLHVLKNGHAEGH